jgi:hypothetical protein
MVVTGRGSLRTIPLASVEDLGGWMSVRWIGAPRVMQLHDAECCGGRTLCWLRNAVH